MLEGVANLDYEMNLRRLESIAGLITGGISGKIHPQNQLLPNVDHQLMAITTCSGQNINRYNYKRLLAVFENRINGLLTIFIKPEDGIQEITVLDPNATEIRLFWLQKPKDDYYAEALTTISLSPKNFAEIKDTSNYWLSQKGLILTTANHPSDDPHKAIPIIISTS